jgi:hypothetical protein
MYIFRIGENNNTISPREVKKRFTLRCINILITQEVSISIKIIEKINRNKVE